ncbi:hypothetical protein ARALYDRAFT_921125 [Arabidopsis lyrata subsp. lyrata]|uniref:Uncharacterized protein n=1 Tax=Arabidopsis lyrata subsp. lyrata TaxID=81972 RepID=D7MYE5_ARALL|nr:hypothetical protein ARALYDRAFT_921125 [Arabidopsis lyrata subsp. lyrata]
METAPPSLVSKARTAFNSAAAKAERVFTDLKSDREEEKQSTRDVNDSQVGSLLRIDSISEENE